VRLPIDTPLLVGRGASNHVILDDPRVSRQHARFAPERGGPVLYDLDSANGTLVNGIAVSRRRLQPGDVIRFGPCVFRIDETSSDAAPAREREVERPTLSEIGGAAGAPLVPESARACDRPLVDLTQLGDAQRRLGVLYSFMQAIGQTLDRRELLRLIGGKVHEVYPRARSVAIYLREGAPTGRAALHLVHSSGSETTDAAALPEDVSQAVLVTSRAGLAADVPESARALGGTDMFAPMIHQGDVCGVIHVSTDPDRPWFSASDLELLNGVAAAAAMMLQNARTHEDTLLRDRLKYDLELAARIQQSFLPHEVITVEGLELFAEYRAAYTVGGDFYDVLWVGEHKLAVFIGDISGHGIAAALFMARISSELRVAALAHVEPVAVFEAMNEALLASDQPELFFTAVYFTFDVKTGEVVLSSAGHPSPYVCRSSGRTERITQGASSAIGILEAPGLVATTLHLGLGDSLVLYTDGVIEAADVHGTLYGSSRLEACLETSGTTRPKDLARRVLRSVEEHATETPVSDDLTLFVFHRAFGRSASRQPRRPSGSLSLPRPQEIEGRA
jgi:serine phosphatase RsbU (regulator of sigma subunit)